MIKFFGIIFLWGLSLSGCSQAPCEKYASNYVPKDLNEALEFLYCNSPDKEKNKFRSLKEENLFEYHFGAGLSIRNSWGLWQGNNELVKSFNKIGIHHPDDMSAIILKSFHRKLNNKDIDLNGQVKFYKDYWAEYKKSESQFDIKSDSLFNAFNIGDKVSIYYYLEKANKTPRIFLAFPYYSVKELRSVEQAVCEIKGIIKEKNKNLDAGGNFKIEITDLCGFNKVQFGENNYLKLRDTFEFEVSHNSPIEKLK
jgi:hypothetical protein